MGAVAPTLPARDFVRPSVVTGPPPPLPPRHPSAQAHKAQVQPGPMAPTAPTAPTAPSSVGGGKLYELRKWVKDTSDKISPSREYWITSDLSVKGRETSVFLFISVFISIMTAVIPIISGDTELYECEEDGDSGEEVCVPTGDNNPIVYIFLAFYQYPWVLVVYLKTGIWMNASGINVKVNALYGEFSPATELLDWEKKDFYVFIDTLGLLCAILGYAVFYHQTLCTCFGEGINPLVVLFVIIGGILSFLVIIAYGMSISYSGYDPKQRVKIMSRIFFIFEVATSGVLYIGTYGYAGVCFMLVPILGYIESFGFIDFGSICCRDHGSCCGMC